MTARSREAIRALAALGRRFATIAAGAPLDHVNNLHTAVIEAIVLGDGGPRHQRTLQALVGAKATCNWPTARVSNRPGQVTAGHPDSIREP